MKNKSEIMRLLSIIDTKVPRISLAFLPTPVHKLTGLSQKYGADIYIKRDDMTGGEFGGNKTRKLEYVLPDVLAQGADYIVTAASVQSNWCRQVVSVAARNGLNSILYLFGHEIPEELRGNLLLDKIMGAEVNFIQLDKGESLYQGLQRTDSIRKKRIAQLESEGHKCHYIEVGAPCPKGHISYLAAIGELITQLETMGLAVDDFDYMVTPIGAGGTYTGMSMAKKLFDLKAEILGFCTSTMHPTMVNDILQASEATSDFLNIDLKVDQKNIHVDFDYAGEYDVPTYLSTQAIKIAAQNDGIFLDPVYTSKAMSGLLDYLQKGNIPSGKRILFWHTGGVPALFSEEQTAGSFFD